MTTKSVTRRNFIASTGAAVAGSVLIDPLSALAFNPQTATAKMKIAIVGTGTRAFGMWAQSVLRDYPDQVEYVGLCDINPGRLEFFKERLGVSCPTFTDFNKMMKEVKPDTLVVTTVDSTHHEFIIKGMEMGANVITEKPMTTDEKKCEAILQAEKKTGKKVSRSEGR